MAHRARADGAAALAPHFAHVERAFRLPRWDTREDVPEWMRRTALVLTLHGMHYTGYVFNDYARMLEILQWVATRIDPARVLVFLASWDGRYYWDYPAYRPAARMGGEEGFRTLIRRSQALGFHLMPMFAANAANRQQPSFARFADAFTSKVDGDRFDLNWVDWDNDRHHEGWLSYMNLGVESWRRWLTDRIADVISRYAVDAYFFDIVGGWVNNAKADMHEGTRRLVAELRGRFPRVAAVGEMHYDALVEFIPLYHSFGQTRAADLVQRHARFFQHLSHPAPGRGSTGVHEAGFGRWNPQTLCLTEHLGAERRVDPAAVAPQRLHERTKVVARHDGVDAGRPCSLGARVECRPEHPLLAPLVVGLEKQRRSLRTAVDRDDRPRLDDARQVEELIGLAERLFARSLGGALQNRDRVADALDDLRAARSKLLRRKNLCAGEHRLRRRPRANGDDGDGRDCDTCSAGPSVAVDVKTRHWLCGGPVGLPSTSRNLMSL